MPKLARMSIRASMETQVDNRWKEWKAPRALVAEVHRQLIEMHNIRSAPRPYAAIYHDWIKDPFGGGVHFWNVGVKSWEEIPNMVHPVPKAPVYVCGEAYSDSQGWVEGALRTAECVCTKHFGLPRMRFLPEVC